MTDRSYENAVRARALRIYHVLDTPDEPQFDDVALLASKLCAAPIASVTFADAYRFWSKARVGFAERNCEWEAGLCSVAFDDEVDPLIVEDLSIDPRFRNKTLVHGEPHLRFYASVQLRTPEGRPIGTLCVADIAPRPGGLSDAQLEGLKALGRHTMALLWLRVALRDVVG